MSGSTLSTEFQFLDANRPNGKFKTIQPRTKDLEYSVAHRGDSFYITTNYNAKNFRLMKTSTNRTTRRNWREVIAHRDDVLLESVELFNNYLVIGERKNGLRQIRVIDEKNNKEHYLDFGEAAYVAYPIANFEMDIFI